jgi:hypothetical protein
MRLATEARMKTMKMFGVAAAVLMGMLLSGSAWAGATKQLANTAERKLGQAGIDAKVKVSNRFAKKSVKITVANETDKGKVLKLLGAKRVTPQEGGLLQGLVNNRFVRVGVKQDFKNTKLVDTLGDD